jgi:hypothetical protein
MYYFRIFFFIITALALICSNYTLSQEPATAQYNEYYNYADTTHKLLNAKPEELKIEVRIPPDVILEKYRSDSSFDYENKLENKEDWITKITSWINEQLRGLRYSDTYSTALDVLYYILILFALIIIVWGLLKGDKGFLFFGKSVENEINLTEQKEDINQINFDQLILRAIENKNYKLAIRYLFLKSLKLLSDNDIIEYKKEKTNYQYLAEIKDMQLASTFRETAHRFDWIWYGDFPIDEKLMDNSQQEFNKLFRLLKS